MTTYYRGGGGGGGGGGKETERSSLCPSQCQKGFLPSFGAYPSHAINRSITLSAPLSIYAAFPVSLSVSSTSGHSCSVCVCGPSRQKYR